MGTSINQASPDTPSWLAVKICYRFSDLPIERVVKEVWRASCSDELSLASQLENAKIAAIAEIAFSRSDAESIGVALTEFLYQNPSPSLATQIAMRAAIQTAESRDRCTSFVSQLFAEASNYLVSRDLPGSVGLGRFESISDAYAFKVNVCAAVKNRIAGYSRVELGSSIDERLWPSTCRELVQLLLE